MAKWRRGKYTLCLWIMELVFIILFAIFVRYDDVASAGHPGHSKDASKRGNDPNNNPIKDYYPMFQDVHVMIFVGFGFLMTFMKRYGFGAFSWNMMLGAFVIQWSTLVGGWLHMHSDNTIHVSIQSLLLSDFACATVLITFGAVVGKCSPVQYIIIAFLEIIFFSVNEHIGLKYFQAVDVGGSMYVHVFGALFGLACCRFLWFDEILDMDHKDAPTYNSDFTSLIGTIFLWLYWPSFNSALAPGDDQHRAVINTYFALASCCIVAFGMSALVNRDDKLDIEHVQNATLAGGVAVGTVADMMIEPWGALTIGAVAGAVSVLGFRYVTPWIYHKFKFHDSCGVNNLHGMPGIIAGLAGIVMAAMANEKTYGYSVYQVFPAMAPVANSTELLAIQSEFSVVEAGKGRSAQMQAAYQAAALGVTIAIACVSGAITGIIVRLPLWNQPRGHDMFDDTPWWTIPDGYPPAYEPGSEPEGHKENGRFKEGKDNQAYDVNGESTKV